MRNVRRCAAASMLLGAAGLVAPGAWAQAQPAAASVHDSFVGVYTLAEFGGHGDEPTGRISYDGAGHMSAMLLPPGREPVTNDSTAEDVRDSMRGVVAYYGTYEIDEQAGTVVHHVEAASNPAWIGADFVRWFRFEDGNLRLSLNEAFENTLLWERLPTE